MVGRSVPLTFTIIIWRPVLSTEVGEDDTRLDRRQAGSPVVWPGVCGGRGSWRNWRRGMEGWREEGGY